MPYGNVGMAPSSYVMLRTAAAILPGRGPPLRYRSCPLGRASRGPASPCPEVPRTALTNLAMVIGPFFERTCRTTPAVSPKYGDVIQHGGCCCHKATSIPRWGPVYSARNATCARIYSKSLWESIGYLHTLGSRLQCVQIVGIEDVKEEDKNRTRPAILCGLLLGWPGGTRIMSYIAPPRVVDSAAFFQIGRGGTIF